jgi:small nuclear ribonucleoprotein F
MIILNPNSYLKSLSGKYVSVKLKWGMIYKGKLESFDSYMNLRLSATEEWIDGKHIGNLGQILIRCNNIIYISEHK